MTEFSYSVLWRNNIYISFGQKDVPEDIKLPVDVKQNIYIIFKERINNIDRHSKATEVIV